MGAELFGRSGLRKWYNGKKNGFLKWVVRGLGNECLWSTQPLVWKGAVKVQSIIVMAYLLSKAGNIKGFLLPAGSALSQGTVGGWWLLSGTGDDRAVKALRLQSCSGHPPGPAKAPVPPWCFLVRTHPVPREKPGVKTESSDTRLMEALRQGLSLATGNVGK